jgi:putative FmdB family regulatory protein
MPIYEYQCLGCAHEFETIQKFSDPELTRCPQCGEDLLKKKISAVAFRLKGGGWYETDFKSGDKRNVAGGDETTKNSDAETKPAAADTSSAATSGDGATKRSDGSGSATSKDKSTSKEASGTAKSVEKTAKPSASKSGSKQD